MVDLRAAALSGQTAFVVGAVGAGPAAAGAVGPDVAQVVAQVVALPAMEQGSCLGFGNSACPAAPSF